MHYDLLRQGLQAPICLTWEMTYACNLRCVHCLSSSGKRAPDELTTEEARRLLDDWAAMQVFYINVGGGEPMTRPDFFELMEYAIDHRIGVKFSTNGTLVDHAAARWIATTDYLDVQISLRFCAVRGTTGVGSTHLDIQICWRWESEEFAEACDVIRIDIALGNDHNGLPSSIDLR